MGMVVLPCSINSVASIAYCQADNLLTRASSAMTAPGSRRATVAQPSRTAPAESRPVLTVVPILDD